MIKISLLAPSPVTQNGFPADILLTLKNNEFNPLYFG